MAENRLDANIVLLLNRIGTKFIMSTDSIEKADLNMAAILLNSALLIGEKDISRANRLYRLASRLYRERSEVVEEAMHEV